MLGADIEAGLIPADRKLVGGMVEDICYRNAERYFGLNAGRFDADPAAAEKGPDAVARRRAGST
jgi:glucuronate isomerase